VNAPASVTRLHIAAPPDDARESGGEWRDPYGGTKAPFALLPEGPYWTRVRGWRIRPMRFGWRAPRRGMTEREWDWRVFLQGPVYKVADTHPDAPAARSALFQYKTKHDADPWISIVLRFTVTEKSEARIVPPGGELWKLLALIGHRNAPLTADVLDTVIGRTLCTETTVTTEQRARGSQRRVSIPMELRESKGHAVTGVL